MNEVLCLPSPAARRWKESALRHGPSGRPRRAAGRAAGFTLPELLVVVGIIAVLLGLLLPSIAAAQNRAKAAVCLSNVRQLCLGMSAYASASDGRYPPNTSTPSPGLNWYDDGRIAGYVSGGGAAASGD